MRISSLLLAISASSAVYAQSRPSTTNMSCAQAVSVVQSQGAAVLGTGGDTFDRFVRDASFCPRGQQTQPRFVPTADNRQCMVGFACFDPSKENR